MNWFEENSYLSGYKCSATKILDPLRVAAFDLDDTLYHVKKSRLKDYNFTVMSTNISEKISDLVKNDYCIVIFTNQSGMANNVNFSKISWKKSVENLFDIMFKLNNKPYLFYVYAAKDYDLYRKPNIGLWNQFRKDIMKHFKLTDLRISNKSFYCGDAAGRIARGDLNKDAKNKPDFSDTDRKFSLNIKLQFKTPETFFLGQESTSKYILKGLNPTEYLKKLNVTVPDTETKFIPRDRELIIMVGPPGSGKSSFVKKYIKPHGYVRINQDKFGSKSKCLALTDASLSLGKSVVIDNTNPDIMTRMDYTAIGIKYGYKHIRAIVMDTDPDLTKHLSNVRHVYSGGAISKINNITYNIFYKKYIDPIKAEHYDSIQKIKFVFDQTKLQDEKWLRIFMRWSD